MRRKSRRRVGGVEIVLPAKRKKPSLDPAQYTGLLYGREKIGKTSFLAQWPDVLFLATEPGTKGLEIFEIPIPDWKTMLGAIDALEADKKRFKTVVIDTVDLAYDFCLDAVCNRLGIPYPGEDDQGREDWGKSWRAVRDEFVDAVNRIIRTGRGLWFTSHAREREVKSRSGDRYDRIGPSMSKQASTVIEALVDLYFYCDYFRSKGGDTTRVIVCEGDETVFAGHRETAGQFPALLPLVQSGGYEMFVQAFRGEHPGLAPTDLMIHRTTSPTAGKLVRQMTKSTRKEALPKRTPTKKVAKKTPTRRR